MWTRANEYSIKCCVHFEKPDFAKTAKFEAPRKEINGENFPSRICDYFKTTCKQTYMRTIAKLTVKFDFFRYVAAIDVFVSEVPQEWIKIHKATT